MSGDDWVMFSLIVVLIVVTVFAGFMLWVGECTGANEWDG